MAVAAKVASKAPARISPWVLWPLSAWMLMYAALPILGSLAPKAEQEAQVEMMRKLPWMASIREPDGDIKLLWRLRDAPVLYGGHILASVIWTIGIPLQHIAVIRRKYPAFHRAIGYAAFTASVGLTVSGLLFLPYKLAYTHPNRFHLHRPLPKLLPWFGWPTFEMSALLLGPLQLVTAGMMLQAARRRDIATHQRLATIHTITGLTVHIERVMIPIFNLVAALIRQLSVERQTWLGVPTDEKEFWRGEMASFAGTVWAAFLITGPWAWSMMDVQKRKVKAA